MKNAVIIVALMLLFTAISCTSDDNVVATEIELHDPFYFNFSIDDHNYALTEDNASLRSGAFNAGCVSSSGFVGGFAHGSRATKFTSHGTSGNEVESISLAISQKIGIIDLNLSDDLNYMRKVLNRANDWRFPTVKEGFAPIRDHITQSPSEIYLTIKMANGDVYSSTLEEVILRNEEAFFDQTRVLNLGEFAPVDYTYVISANFKVDLYKEGNPQNNVIIMGSLNLPIYTFTTEEAQMMCQ